MDGNTDKQMFLEHNKLTTREIFCSHSYESCLLLEQDIV